MRPHARKPADGGPAGFQFHVIGSRFEHRVEDQQPAYSFKAAVSGRAVSKGCDSMDLSVQESGYLWHRFRC